ncbi:MAG: helicase-related protein [Candidatus Micrarchaeota archaeon]
MDLPNSEFLLELSLKPAADLLEARDYQINIAKSILRRGNSLVIMPTALGKTFIAILAMAKYVKEMHEGKRKRKKFLFLTPTKPLANQQAKRILELIDFGENEKGGLNSEKIEELNANSTIRLTGLNDPEIDSKKLKRKKKAKDTPPQPVMLMTGENAPEKRSALWKSDEIWCYAATPQTVEFDVLAGRMDLSDFCLVVLDEAHRAVKDYSYSFVAREASKRGLLLIGLTASPSADRKMIDEICMNLNVRNIEIRSETDIDVRKYAHEIKLDWVFVDLPEEMQKIKRQLLELLKEALAQLKELGAMGSVEMKSHKRELLALRHRALANLNGDPANYHILSVHARAMNISHAIDLIEIEGASALLEFMREMEGREKQSKAVRGILADPRWLAAQRDCMEFLEKGKEHPKFEKLVGILKKQPLGGGKAIVFAHYRNTVKKITKVLGEIEGIRPVEFIGKSKGGMGQKAQQQAMQEFRDGKYNVLVATSVAEEGLDIPDVELVVFFESVPSEIRLIQRRGRTGRIKDGKAIVLITKGSKDEALFWSSKYKEKKMKRVVEGLRTSLLDAGAQNELMGGQARTLLDY